MDDNFSVSMVEDEQLQTIAFDHTRYAIDYVLGGVTHILVVDAPDRDEAYYLARKTLVSRGLFSASLQGSCRIATQSDLDRQTKGL